jgi:UDP-glucuronate decarboxylase
MVSQALAGEDVTIYGDGSQTRSFCYVSDQIDGLMRLMAYDGPQPGPVNIGNPIEKSILELAQTVMRITDSGSELVFKPLPADDPKRRRPDISKAQDLLGWKPKVGLEEGLRATIRWFEDERRRHRPQDDLRRDARVA